MADPIVVTVVPPDALEAWLEQMRGRTEYTLEQVNFLDLIADREAKLAEEDRHYRLEHQERMRWQARAKEAEAKLAAGGTACAVCSRGTRP